MTSVRRRALIAAVTVATVGLPATALALPGGTQATADNAPAAITSADPSPTPRDPARDFAGDDERGFTVVGLTDQGRLVTFRTNSPDRIRRSAKVRGLIGDQRLVGVDYRVQDRKLYGVGDLGGVY